MKKLWIRLSALNLTFLPMSNAVVVFAPNAAYGYALGVQRTIWCGPDR